MMCVDNISNLFCFTRMTLTLFHANKLVKYWSWISKPESALANLTGWDSQKNKKRTKLGRYLLYQNHSLVISFSSRLIKLSTLTCIFLCAFCFILIVQKYYLVCSCKLTTWSFYYFQLLLKLWFVILLIVVRNKTNMLPFCIWDKLMIKSFQQKIDTKC